MKGLFQNWKTGATAIVDVPVPLCQPGHVCIRTRATLISAGTERMLLEFGNAGWIKKARQQPDKVQQVLDKVRMDGLLVTIDAIRSKLDQLLPFGYCNAGIVAEVGAAVQGFSVGDRVTSNGSHAEIVCVPQNLCAGVPDSVSDEEAAFTVLGAIGLQGVRLAQPTLGECFIVTGLGLIGLITVQLLKANGCRVLGIDVDSSKCRLAETFGAETVDLSKGQDPLAAAEEFSRSRGVDGVLITALTKSSEPIHQAAQMCRKRGRIVLVGVTGLELRRADFYEKELTFQVSCSYGPGRYDPDYEEKGNDYPVGYVRWTEQRNLNAVLDMMAAAKLDVKPLITHRFPFEQAGKAYDLIVQNKEPYVGIILEYGKRASELRVQSSKFTEAAERTIRLRPGYEQSVTSKKRPAVGMIGAGDFAGRVLVPAMRKTDIRLKKIASTGGVSGTHLGKKFGFEESTTDVETIFSDPEIDTVFITTRHNTHARFVIKALNAGKHVFVEKPLCLTHAELEEIQKTYSSLITDHSPLILMVGFNRRFGPHVIKIKELLGRVREPKSMIMTVNAGALTPDHWTQDSDIGGGRIVGEACHFIDLLTFLAGKGIQSSEITKMDSGVGDTVSIQLSFAGGSIGTIHYFANGSRRFPKERLEVFAGGKILQLENFKVLRGYSWKGFKKMRLWRQDKGHGAEIRAFLEAVQNGGPSPIPFEEVVEVSKTTIDLSLRS
jgi:predicted dehydrogenase/threonine dehydrogenase-like Zn-dependent dehydrogenase